MKQIKLIIFLFALANFNLYGLTNWTGNTDTNWFNPANWDNGLPGPGNDVVIPAVPPGGLFPEITVPVIQNYQIDNRGVISIPVTNQVTFFDTPVFNSVIKCKGNRSR